VPPATNPIEIDPLTIASIGVLAYITGNIIHEGLGHGGACLITGGRPLLITAVNMDCSADNRFVIAGGSLMNTIAAALFFLLLRITPRTRSIPPGPDASPLPIPRSRPWIAAAVVIAVSFILTLGPGIPRSEPRPAGAVSAETEMCQTKLCRQQHLWPELF
jgi:hypothetical protein